MQHHKWSSSADFHWLIATPCQQPDLAGSKPCSLRWRCNLPGWGRETSSRSMHRASLWVGIVCLWYDTAQHPKHVEVAPPLQMLHQAKTRGASLPRLSSDGSSASRCVHDDNGDDQHHYCVGRCVVHHFLAIRLMAHRHQGVYMMTMVMTSIIIVWVGGCNVALCMIC